MALADNLISYWSLEEASGTRIDAVVASANDLTDNNTVTQNTGKIANCAQFTSANSEYLSIADNASLSTGDIDFTWTAWVYLDSLSKYHMAVTKGTDAGVAANFEYSLYVSDINRPVFSVANTGIGTATWGSGLSVSTWYFLTGYHDSAANVVGIVVDAGTPVTTSYSGGSKDSALGFNIGRDGIAGRYVNGRIDEVGFWKRVLTSGERTQLYNAGAGMSYADIIGPQGQPTALRHSLMRTGARRFGRGIS